MTTRVAIVGGTGKLGGIIRDVIDGDDDFEVVATLSLALGAVRARGRGPGRRRLDPGRLHRRRPRGDRARHQRPRRHVRLVGGAHRAGAAPRGCRRHGRRVHPELLARIGDRLGARGSGGAVLPVHRDRRGAPRDEGGFAQRHRGAHGGAHRSGARRGRAGRVAARRPARPRPAGRQRADPLAAPPRRPRASGGRAIGARGVPDPRPRHRRPGTGLCPRHPRGPRRSARRARRDRRARQLPRHRHPRAPSGARDRQVDEGGVPGQVARATGA